MDKKYVDTINKVSSTYCKKNNTIRRKWLIDQHNIQLLKFENRQLHNLFNKLIADGRITIDELRSNVNSRVEASNILFRKRNG